MKHNIIYYGKNNVKNQIKNHIINQNVIYAVTYPEFVGVCVREQRTYQVNTQKMKISFVKQSISWRMEKSSSCADEATERVESEVIFRVVSR